MTDADLTTVADFDAADPAVAAGLLRPACASCAWVDRLVAERPHRTPAALLAASDRAISGLSWPDLQEALAAHPRIGDRARGTDLESSWSRQEQSATERLDTGVAADLRVANAEYEQHFGHVFLICATGRSAEQMLASLRERLGNDAGTEREVVRGELGAIVALRLARTFR